MEVSFRNRRLERCAEDPRRAVKTWPANVATSYINAVIVIRAAKDAHELSQIRSLKLSAKKGRRKDQHSIQLNNRWRLILRINDAGDSATIWEVTNHYDD